MSCSSHSSNCSCSSCCGGCPVNLDFSCVFYHKDNNKISELDGLNLSNGSTLEMVIELLDEKIKQLNVTSFNLPILRVGYVINTMQQFAQAVDTQIGVINDEITDLQGSATVDLIANDSTSIGFSTSGTLNHTLTGSVIISALDGNRISIEEDGLFAAPQTVSIDYDAKTLTLSDSNTVSIASLLTGTSGFLGNLASDPTAIDGQYYFNTNDGTLRFKVNGNWGQVTISF